MDTTVRLSGHCAAGLINEPKRWCSMCLYQLAYKSLVECHEALCLKLYGANEKLRERTKMIDVTTKVQNGLHRVKYYFENNYEV